MASGGFGAANAAGELKVVRTERNEEPGSKLDVSFKIKPSAGWNDGITKISFTSCHQVTVLLIKFCCF